MPVSVDFTGMGSIFLETNGMSTVNDPSGTVFVDILPPQPPAPRPGDGPHATDEGLIPAWYADSHKRHPFGVFDPTIVVPWDC